MMRKLITIIIIISILASYVGIGQFNQVSAQFTTTVIQKSELNIDENLIIDSDLYKQPRSILVSPIFTDSETNLSPLEWYQGLFYYFSSNRFNFKDIPAHYIINEEGEIYQGINGGVERQVVVENGPDSPIVIWYLASSGESSFNLNAQTNLRNFITKLANENRIRADNIQLAKIELEIDSANKQVNLVTDEIFGSWNIDFEKITEYADSNYSPSIKEYVIELKDIKAPEQAVQAGTEIVIPMRFENIGENSIYAGTDSELILETSSGEESPLFLSGTWLSRSQVNALEEGEILRPNEEKTFDIRLYIPLGPDRRITEEFILTNGYGTRFESAIVNLDLQVTKGDLELVQILNTETGTLNVRSAPAFGAEAITKIAPGDYFEVVDTASGWYEIKLPSAGTGWISARYARVL
jgi:hypothetical protein